MATCEDLQILTNRVHKIDLAFKSLKKDLIKILKERKQLELDWDGNGTPVAVFAPNEFNHDYCDRFWIKRIQLHEDDIEDSIILYDLNLETWIHSDDIPKEGFISLLSYIKW